MLEYINDARSHERKKKNCGGFDWIQLLSTAAYHGARDNCSNCCLSP